ncbi:MAG TPA: 2-phosphosulfolactate phosphatase [Thermoguttaceae bacterium]
MPPRFYVYALPKFVGPEEVADGTAVVIDVLRSSTTIVYALQAGAKAVIPCREISEARSIAAQYARDQVVLGGERGGLAIDGFDLGNSPHEYTPEIIKNKIVVFTTSNGTQALSHVKKARQIVLGSFVNATAVIQKLQAQKKVHLVCAGTDGQLSEDDVLLAGMLIDTIQRQGGVPYELNPQAIAAQDLWLHTCTRLQVARPELPNPGQLREELRKSLGGQNLVAIGLENDITAAAQIDRFKCVPQFDAKTSMIQLMK